MVEETGTESAAKSEPPTGPYPWRSEKPVIDGKIIASETTSSEPSNESAPPVVETVGTASEPARETADKDASTAEPGRGPAPPNDGKMPRRRMRLWPIVAALLIGAGLALGAIAYIRGFDTTAERIATLASGETELAARVAALEKKPDAATLREALAAQEKRIAAVEASVRDAMATAKSALAAAQTRAPNAPPAGQPTADLSPLETKVGELDRRLADLDQKLAAVNPPAAPKSELRVSANGVFEPKAEAQTVAIVAASLLSKVERGLPYAAELNVLGHYQVDKAKLATLRAKAATGVPSSQALAAHFAALTASLLAPEPLKPEGTILERMVQSASRLVRVRKVGDTQGNDLPALVARIGAALQTGAVEDALTLWDGLPARAKAKSQDFADLAKSRVETLAAARAIEADAIAALGPNASK